MPEISNTRFGKLEYIEEDVVTFPEGIVGFPDCTRFVFVSNKQNATFRWLQSVELPEFAFLVTDPSEIVQGYEPVLGEAFAKTMGIEATTPTMLLATVSIPPGKPEEMTVNLAGPIVINAATRIGRQFVIEDEAYTIKHRVFPAGLPESERAAA
jgi:flagellar assembly factor FliW